MAKISVRSAENISPEIHSKEWKEYTEASWGHSIPTADLRYMSEFIYLIDKYSGSETKNILEWGTGFTTRWLCAIAEKRRSELFVAVDTNAEYLSNVIAFMPQSSFTLEAHAVMEIGDTDDFSQSPAFHYATFPFKYEKHFDLIFIDGRRRNECLMAAAVLLSEHGFVIIHDFRRKRYELGISFFQTVEDFFGFRVLKRNPKLDDFFKDQFEILTKDASSFPASFSEKTNSDSI